MYMHVAAYVSTFCEGANAHWGISSTRVSQRLAVEIVQHNKIDTSAERLQSLPRGWADEIAYHLTISSADRLIGGVQIRWVTGGEGIAAEKRYGYLDAQRRRFQIMEHSDYKLYIPRDSLLVGAAVICDK